MTTRIVQSSTPVTLIGGGDARADQLTHALRLAPFLVAADSGADFVAAQGKAEDLRAVIGDMDSIDARLKAALTENQRIELSEQDSTDFEKALSCISAPLILGLGFQGGRLDHELAAMNALVRFPHQRCVLLGAREAVFLCPPSLMLDLPEDTRVSLFPLGAVEMHSEGLTWSTRGLNFAPDGRIGTSNRAKGAIRLQPTAPKMLVLVPVRFMEQVVEALSRSHATWPAP